MIRLLIKCINIPVSAQLTGLNNQVISLILKLYTGNLLVVMLTTSTPQNIQPGLVLFF